MLHLWGDGVLRKDAYFEMTKQVMSDPDAHEVVSNAHNRPLALIQYAQRLLANELGPRAPNAHNAPLENFVLTKLFHHVEGLVQPLTSCERIQSTRLPLCVDGNSHPHSNVQRDDRRLTLL